MAKCFWCGTTLDVYLGKMGWRDRYICMACDSKEEKW